MKKALITGVTGQDGSYLSEFLLSSGYKVDGIIRRGSVFTTERIDHLLNHQNFNLHHGDLNDSSNLFSLINTIRPDEVYHLGAQSHVGVSFEVPEYTGDVIGLGTLRLLNAIKAINRDVKFYNASTSEMFGGFPNTVPQSESTRFHPRSPYGAAKLYAYWLTTNYREAFNMFATSGILFNHESPRRGETFVTRKISIGVARYKNGFPTTLSLGNLDSVRDWGFAGDYVKAMWAMLQKSQPSDYVIATGHGCTVREFAELAFKCINVNIDWVGQGVNEKGVNSQNGQVLIEVSEKYFRPSEVDCLIGDASLARKELNWEPSISVEKLVEMMVFSDMEKISGR